MQHSQRTKPAGTSAQCVLVLGMHRSGTSACTRALSALGLHLGDEHALLAADVHNPLGYFEPSALVDLNDRILSEWGASWCNPRLAARPSELAALSASLQAEMADYVAQWVRLGRVWAWKDPRLCITYQLWAPLLPEHVVLIVERDPSEVAASLHARDGIAPLAGVALWEVYTRALLAEVSTCSHAFVRYRGLLECPRDELARIGAFLESCGVLESLDLEQAVASIDPNLCHGQAFQKEPDQLSAAQKHLHRQLAHANPEATALDGERQSLLDACLQQVDHALRSTLSYRATIARLESFEREALQRYAQEVVGLTERIDSLERRKLVRVMRRMDEAKHWWRGRVKRRRAARRI